MKFDTLPGDIYLIVVHCAVRKEYSNKYAWKGSLPLLWVCRGLRHAVLPLIYRTVFVECQVPNQNRLASHMEGLENKAPQLMFVDNIPFFTSKSYIQLARDIHITIQASHHYGPQLCSILDELRRVSRTWSSVHTLSINMGFLQPADAESNEYLSKIGETLHNFIQSMAGVIPNYVNLNLKETLESKTIAEIYGGVTSNPHTPVQGLNSHSDGWQIVDVAGTPSALTRICLTFRDSTNYWLILSAAKTLQHMSLSAIPQSHEHSLVGCVERGTAVEFPELQTLSIAYSVEGKFCMASKPMDNSRLLLPQLKYFCIKGGSNYCPILAAAEFPGVVQKVEFDVGKNLLELAKKSSFQEIQALLVNTRCCSSNASTTFGPALSQLYKQKRITQTGKLDILGDLSIEPEMFKYQTITHLKYRGIIDPGDVIEFICKLTMLVKVEFTGVNGDGKDIDMEIPAPGETHCMVTPFKAPIKSLSINYCRSLTNEDPSDALINNILLRLPKLLLIESRYFKVSTINRFVTLYKIHYPHLQYVQLKLLSS